MIELKIYVPKPGTVTRAMIAHGSGIVGSLMPRLQDTPYCIEIDYEGNLHGACNIVTWEDKVFHAAGRHVQNYPTIARAWPLEDELIEVGRFTCNDDWSDKRYIITNQEALDTWL